MKSARSFLIVAALFVFSSVALAATPEATMTLDRWVIGSGELPRSAVSLKMQGTIGQPLAGYVTASTLALHWGYWGPESYVVYLPLVLRS